MKMQPDQQEQEYTETELGWLPEEWKVTNIGEVCDVSGGGTPSTAKKAYWTREDIPWIKSGQCHDCYVNKAEQFITKEGLENCSAKMLKQNTVLVAMVGATVGKTGFLTFSACSNQNVAGLFPKGNARLDSLFLFFCLQSRYDEFTKTKGFIIANLSFIRNLKIPIPSLAEQQRIALVLLTIKKAELKTENVINSLKDLKKSLMKHLFTYGPTSLQDSPKVVLKETDTGEVPEKWHIVKLSNVFKLTSGKERPKGIMSSKTALNFYPVYGGNGIMGYSKEKLLDKSAIIIGRVGEYCGVCYLSKEECWVSDNALYSKELLLSVNLDYLCLALEKLDLNRLKNTGGQPLISQSIVYSQSIPLPSNQEQEEIAKTISVIDRAIEAEQSNRKSLDNLFKSMLGNLMSAKIRLNDLEF
jgi:type I restriction enzyme, S subunit